MLRGGHSLLEGAVLEEWEKVQQCMEQEIGIRLEEALLRVSGFFKDTFQETMICQAPYELIKMFNDL
jgi:hypothetical protein